MEENKKKGLYRTALYTFSAFGNHLIVKNIVADNKS